MRVRKNCLAMACAVVLGLVGTAAADWVQDGGSLNVDPMKNCSSPCLACDNGTPYVAWSEAGQIYVKHYSGNTWIQDGGSLNVSNTRNAYYPALDLYSTSTPYVAWNEDNGTTNQIYVKHYNGAAWIQDGGSLNVNVFEPAYYRPSLAVFNNLPYVSWSETNGTKMQLYIRQGLQFVAVAGGGSNLAATSPDGITWTQRTMPVTATPTSLL